MTWKDISRYERTLECERAGGGKMGYDVII